MPFTKPRKILQQGTRADQPDATTVLEGTLYFVTDEGVIERSNATTWDSWDLTAAIEILIVSQQDWIDLVRFMLQRLDFLEAGMGTPYTENRDIDVPAALSIIDLK